MYFHFPKILFIIFFFLIKSPLKTDIYCSRDLLYFMCANHFIYQVGFASFFKQLLEFHMNVTAAIRAFLKNLINSPFNSHSNLAISNEFVFFHGKNYVYMYFQYYKHFASESYREMQSLIWSVKKNLVENFLNSLVKTFCGF